MPDTEKREAQRRDWIDVLMDEDKPKRRWEQNDKGNYVLVYGRFLLTVFPRANFTGGKSWRWSRSAGLGKCDPIYGPRGFSTPEKAQEAALLAAEEAMMPPTIRDTNDHDLNSK